MVCFCNRLKRFGCSQICSFFRNDPFGEEVYADRRKGQNEKYKQTKAQDTNFDLKQGWGYLFLESFRFYLTIDLA
jgi:hypothetical protein